MKNRTSACLLCVWICAFGLWACASLPGKRENSERHFLWMAEKSGQRTVWLLGSIHLADSSFYPLPAILDSALDASTLVAAELDINKSETVQKTGMLMAEKGALPAGTFLKDVLPDSLLNRVDSLLAAWKIPKEIMAPFRPWMVALSLSALAIERSGLSGDFGIDQEILARAEDLGKKIFALETPEEQIGIFSNAEDSLGIEYLQSTLNEILEADSFVRDMATAWKTGDVEKMRRLLDSDSSESAYEEELYVKRNVRMANAADSLAALGEEPFIVVGCAHLVGSGDNVLRLLEKKGYRIRQR
ncbi:TraB/GumN family protein [uncultured Fibrobacter sp.]|uniref:TraB/GumN family protein n=1 Tax=uncultured Fibrobacter sp. TaxID=261512 RepID=UPI0028039582|nr:TraB/GumN family protein [uncultured Fibrobacter sp.]